MSLFRQDALLLVAEYAEERNLLDKKGFKWCKGYLQKHQSGNSNLTKKKQRPQYQYGVELPSSVKHALQLDEQNGNQLWKEAMDKELLAMEEWGVFEPVEDTEALEQTHKKIILLWMFAVLSLIHI